MECPKCGFYMDAFMTDCPRCAKMQKDGITPQPVSAQHSAAPQQAAPAAYARPRASAGTFVVGLKQIVAIASALLVGVGVFLPVVSVPFLGGISLFQAGSMANTASSFSSMSSMQPSPGTTLAIFFLRILWILFLLLAIGAIVAALTRQNTWVWVTGIGSGALSLVVIGSYIYGLVKASAAAAAASSSMSAFSGMGGGTAHTSAMTIFAVTPLGWGAIIQLVGAIMLITAAVLVDPED